jgi:hypothetical protein
MWGTALQYTPHIAIGAVLLVIFHQYGWVMTLMWIVALHLHGLALDAKKELEMHKILMQSKFQDGYSCATNFAHDPALEDLPIYHENEARKMHLEILTQKFLSGLESNYWER